MRVVDHRVHLLRRMPRVTISLQSPLGADDVLAFGFGHVFTATGSTWRSDGLGRRHRQPIAGHGLASVFTPDDVFAGAQIASPVAIYDDDHYVMGAALAEKFARNGLEVHLLTPSTKVSEWTELTMEQARVQARLLELGVQVQTAVELSGITASGSATGAVAHQHLHAPSSSLACASIVMVTMRDPRDDLLRDLLARQDEWAATRRRVGALRRRCPRARNGRRGGLRRAPRGARARRRGRGRRCGAVQAGIDRDRTLTGPRWTERIVRQPRAPTPWRRGCAPAPCRGWPRSGRCGAACRARTGRCGRS